MLWECIYFKMYPNVTELILLAMYTVFTSIFWHWLSHLLQYNYIKRNSECTVELTMCTNCSLNWQHQLCKNPRPNPDIKTLFVDHSCGQPNGARAPSPANNPLLGSVPKPGGFPPLGAHGVGLSTGISLTQWNTEFSLIVYYFYYQPFQPAPTPVPTPLAGWMSNPPTVSHPAVSGGPIGLSVSSIPGIFFCFPYNAMHTVYTLLFFKKLFSIICCIRTSVWPRIIL